MLVSFNPSLSIPNVNRKNPDRTSFQKLSTQDFNHYLKLGGAQNLATDLDQGHVILTKTEASSLLDSATKINATVRNFIEKAIEQYSYKIVQA